MIKITPVMFLFVVCLFVSYNVYSQNVILYQDFSTCKGETPPKNWSNSGKTAKWLFRTGNFTHDFTEVSYDGTFVGIHDEGNKNRESVRLETEIFSLEGFKHVFLSFDLYFREFSYKDTVEKFSITISDDGGKTWDTVANIKGNPLYHKEYCDISRWAGNSEVKLCFNYSDNGTWGYGGFFDNVKVFEPKPVDVQLTDVKHSDYAVLNDSIYISGRVESVGSDTINSLEIAYSVNGGEVLTDKISGLTTSCFKGINFVHSTPWVPNKMGRYNVEIWINKVNGQYNTVDNKHQLSLYGTKVVDRYIKRDVLLEVFAASWCTLCPDAGAKVKEIIDSVSNVIPVAIHIPNHKNDTSFLYKNGDPMYCNEGIDICSYYHSNPGWLASGMIDRYLFVDENSIDLDRKVWAEHIYNRSESVSPVELKLTHKYEASNRVLTVDITAEFACNLTGDFRFNCYIVEDSIEFDQHSWYCNPDRIPYYHNDDWNSTVRKTEHITNFKHMNVLRGAIGGVHGVANSLPDKIKKGEKYKWRFNYQVPAEFNIDNVKFIGIVKRGITQHEILNAKMAFIL